MNRTVGILLVVVAVFTVVCVALMFALERQSFNNAQAALTQYLVYRNGGATSALLVKQFVHATVPSAFTREMSGASFGASTFFGTTVDYRKSLQVNLPNLDTPTPARNDTTIRSLGNPPPYPPDDVWCVLLNDENTLGQVVFIAQHQALYNSDWLVHQPPGDWSAAELNKNLSTIGCQLKIDQ